MARCVVTIEISEYQPKNFNFDNLVTDLFSLSIGFIMSLPL